MDLVALIALVACIAIGAAVFFLSGKAGGKKKNASSGTTDDDAFIPEPDAETQKKLPYLKTNAGPRDPDWEKRIKEEIQVLMAVRSRAFVHSALISLSLRTLCAVHQGPDCERQQVV